MTDMFSLGVLETGRPSEGFTHFDNYPEMVATWLGVPAAEMKAFAALDGELPASPKDADLWVITGSRHGAYEDLPWIPPLEDFIRSCRDAGVPMFGICFGHQIMAQALGGVVRKSDKGWGLGVHDYDTSAWPSEMGATPPGLSLQAWHQDQVETLPDGAQTIATSEFCENAAIWYPGFGMSVQGHPEMTREYAEALMHGKRGVLLSDAEADSGLANTAKPVTAPALADWLKDRWQHL